MLYVEDFIQQFSSAFLPSRSLQPWEVVDNLEALLQQKMETLGDEYIFSEGRAIHKTAIIEPGVSLKGKMILAENCFVGAHAYLRGPLYVGKGVTIGPGCEIKQSMLFEKTSVAHFNYIGNSLIGQGVNFEAGAVCANHYNERQDKTIVVLYRDQYLKTNSQKFGSLVGDYSKLGANAVLSPGTLLEKHSVVKRLELIEQVKV
jgi:UDP-N-acetylglucosamine diphosphorylase / glucose-1-phosphate thymidylyltransferase / UDP-N-acetylgalactosamine diphosphorylase / glucosamine-1-phosphate N-acetyltransferase / galactosamine-1-phosphate N-acetyltransferase